jgi:hypothetical protein
MQVYDDRFQAESGWNCNSILIIGASGGLLKKKSVAMHGNMNVKNAVAVPTVRKLLFRCLILCSSGFQ